MSFSSLFFARGDGSRCFDGERPGKLGQNRTDSGGSRLVQILPLLYQGGGGVHAAVVYWY
jgi:hypothetical protein